MERFGEVREAEVSEGHENSGFLVLSRLQAPVSPQRWPAGDAYAAERVRQGERAGRGPGVSGAGHAPAAGEAPLHGEVTPVVFWVV